MSWHRQWFPNGEWVLLLVVAAEILLFSTIAPNFATLGNFFEITRFSVELGLLAVALTPVIVAGGIDLSVGSMMGLAAVTFGACSDAWHVPVLLAALCALLVLAALGFVLDHREHALQWLPYLLILACPLMHFFMHGGHGGHGDHGADHAERTRS